MVNMRSSQMLLAALAASTGVIAQNSSSCASGLYMIVARGTNEDPGTGSMGELADAVADRIEGSEVVALDYDASLTDPLYDDSVENGAIGMRDMVMQYHEDCPDSLMAIMGYSQGAQVTGDAFCGGGEGWFGDNAPLSSDIVEDSVMAIILFGDPAHTPDAPYNHGTSEDEGLFSRENFTTCEGYTDFLRSYCDDGDRYCGGGGDPDVHGHYVDVYGEEVLEWIVDRYEEVSGETVPDGTGESPFATPTPEADGDENSGGKYAPHLVAIIIPMVVMGLIM